MIDDVILSKGVVLGCLYCSILKRVAPVDLATLHGVKVVLAHTHFAVVGLHAIQESLLLGSTGFRSRGGHLLLCRSSLILLFASPGEASDRSMNSFVGYR